MHAKISSTCNTRVLNSCFKSLILFWIHLIIPVRNNLKKPEKADRFNLNENRI